MKPSRIDPDNPSGFICLLETRGAVTTGPFKDQMADLDKLSSSLKRHLKRVFGQRASKLSDLVLNLFSLADALAKLLGDLNLCRLNQESEKTDPFTTWHVCSQLCAKLAGREAQLDDIDEICEAIGNMKTDEAIRTLREVLASVWTVVPKEPSLVEFFSSSSLLPHQ